ncbi:putative permease (drug-metabolite transporter DMT family) [Bradyrhizobium sp. ORS 278]|uniref:DMT family transporter n=1 Tax=Bradyrhizobium sp. (strain ORS 278) TaxID=114615 RepID=UPI0001507A0F|nr:DMT family transporter [Bradyrhizobium sp. ORS 278]CAL74483.1 putative permease (drug-metabolite transporter DMT family) [Bradyrhizobium sp. ORS 278]
MSAISHSSAATRPLGPGAIAITLVLCLSWAFNQIAIKLALPEVPPMLQATFRSAGALPVLLVFAQLRGVRMFERDGTLWLGLIAGALFGFEFVLIYQGLLLTSASRAVVFLYTAPFFVALGSFRFLGERLGPAQWGGLAMSFTGVALAIGIPQANVDSRVLLGDLLVVGGGLLWGVTTVFIKGTRMRLIAPERALGYQVAVSVPIMAAAALIAGERLTHVPSPFVLGLLAYQAIWVVGTTFTIWFALIKAYSASKLSAFTFITPLFGVVASYFILHDALTLAFGLAAVLVIIGLFLVNRPNRAVAAATDPLLTVTKT